LSLKVTVLSLGNRAAPAAGLGVWLARHAPRHARGEVTIAIVPDRTMQGLNKRFRGMNKATDVLAFPSGSPRPLALSPGLGEIVIARGVAARQARSLGHAVRTELRILALHGLLHLLGYDHEEDNGEMARVEARLRRRARLPDGLIARAS
jgi:probable rRNA maturation factor